MLILKVITLFYFNTIYNKGSIKHKINNRSIYVEIGILVSLPIDRCYLNKYCPKFEKESEEISVLLKAFDSLKKCR